MYWRTTLYAVLGMLLLGVLLFWPAGTLGYWQGWALIAVFVVFTIPYTVYLAVRLPDTLRRRLRAGVAAESRATQKIAVIILQVSVLGMMVIGGFDHRFGWSEMPTWVCVLGIIITSVGLGITILVVLQNSWAAATITTESGQEVVSTGVYSVVRHPMYTGAVILLVGIPLALGSYWGLVLLAPALLSLVIRTLDEEKMLNVELAGYPEYTRTVRYRLLPYLW